MRYNRIYVLIPSKMAINGYCIIIVRLVYVFITRAIEKSYVSLAARVAL